MGRRLYHGKISFSARPAAATLKLPDTLHDLTAALSTLWFSQHCRQSCTASSMFLHKITALAIVACLAVADAAANSTCYYPSGKKTKGGACNANADVSLCCGPSYVCLSNGLCAPGPNTKKDKDYPFYRHGCTDPTYNSTVCPTFCTSGE